MIKCDANCDALGNIWLRNNVFYYKANNCEQETTQKRNAIRTLLKQIKLTFNDD
ncbi:MAG: hypothetical protein J6R52_01570 [Alphaproteobacteria bacterium]|nr:hypothetical protein [Alphaproteobacteria bacterium]